MRSDSLVVRLRHDRRVQVVLALLACAVAGWISSLAMPRGPQRPADVVAAMLIGAVVGLVAGWLLRSRWAALVAPVTFAVVFELGRLGLIGPSVDRPRLTITVGVMVFVLGRLFHGLVLFAPMAVGALYGAAFARRASGGSVSGNRLWRYLRGGLTTLTTLALVALGVLLTRPGTTAPIAGADGKPLAGSVAELVRVKLGGHEQTVLIRGRNVEAPVLLYLAGGPGQSDLIQGTHELRGRLEPARQWFDSLTAPHKEWITFERSGHIPQFEEFARFQQILTDVVVPQTYRQ